MTTTTEVIAEIRRIADLMPDHIYNRPSDSPGTQCQYVHHNPKNRTYVPGCIIGHALWNLGVINPHHFPKADNANRVLPVFGVHPVGEHDMAWITEVQAHQDARQTWGHAIRAADNIVGVV